LKLQAVAEKTAKDARGLLYFAAYPVFVLFYHFWLCNARSAGFI